MLDELTKLAKQQAMLLDMMNEVKQLKTLVTEKDKTIGGLELRIDNLEQYIGIVDLIISGLDTKHQIYARTKARDKDEKDAPTGELQTLEWQVI